MALIRAIIQRNNLQTKVGNWQMIIPTGGRACKQGVSEKRRFLCPRLCANITLAMVDMTLARVGKPLARKEEE